MATYGMMAGKAAKRRLRPFGDAIDSDDLADELELASLQIRTQLPVLGSYDALAGTDQEWFDQAVGVLTAIRLLGTAAGVASGGLSKLKTPDFEYTFATPNEDQQATLANELSQAIGLISVIQSANITIAQQTSVFGLAGRSRAREEAGRMSLAKIIETLLPSGWGGDRPASAGITPGF